MNTTQSIIVYQNPMQAAFWEGGFFIPLVASLAVFLIVVVVLTAIADQFRVTRNFVRKAYGTWPILALASVAGVLTYQHLFI